MVVTAQWYPRGIKSAMNKEVDWNTDDVKLALFTSSHAFNAAHDYFDDIVANEIAGGGGYTTDGMSLTTPTVTDTIDTGLSAWAATTAYVEGDMVRPAAADGHCYMCIVAGTSDGAEPTFIQTLRGQTSETGAVRWAEVGPGFTVFDADNVTWTTSTITAAFAVLYVDTTVATTSALLGNVDFGGDESSSAGNFTVTWSTNGILRTFGAFRISS